jgi:hypothetical protein
VFWRQKLVGLSFLVLSTGLSMPGLALAGDSSSLQDVALAVVSPSAEPVLESPSLDGDFELVAFDDLLPGSDADDLLLEKKKKKKKKGKSSYNTNYRYNWEDRYLSFGLDMGGAIAGGNTLNAFPYGGTVTPYFHAGFGDGNAVQVECTVGYLPLNPTEYGWLWYRTPALPGSNASGYLAFAAPNVQFRYELELGASTSKRAPVLFWGGFGLGALITYGEADLTENGTAGAKNSSLTNTEVFFDFVPTIGLQFRILEFSSLDLGYRQHLFLPIASMLTGEEEWTRGRPTIIPEFWIANARIADISIGFTHFFK